MKQRIVIDLSTTSLIKFFGFILVLVLIYLIKDILVLLFIVVIIVMAIDPLVSYFETKKVPRWIGAMVVYLLILALFGLGIYLIIPPVVTQIKSLANNLPGYAYRFTLVYQFIVESSSDWQQILDNISGQLSKLTGSFYNATLTLFGGITSAITVFILSFYLLLERQSVKQFLVGLLPEAKKQQVLIAVNKITAKLGSWLRGQILVSVVFGLAVGITLAIIGVPYALTLGVIAGILEIIPLIGAVISGVIIVFVSLLTGNWIQALVVLVVYIILQQLENHLLVPKIMQKAVGLSPVVIIIALLVGAKLAGILGAVIAIPVAAALSVLIQEWPKIEKV